ncbi:unnamed protein product [Cuscuta europaea]|uniref:DUF4005 domain-containing protein n=1 Tax=Cuscuta europaea TaxID=41803 RepID=A0A9P1E672_CUSEU|nr:unnamed protein product [Cuscuta europaea]
MGKKGSWFSAIRRVFFTPHSSSKDKRISGPEKTIYQEKKKGRRRILKRGELKSFIFREPSSIEKILGEIDEQRQLVPLYSEQQKIVSERPTSPRSTPPRTTPFRDVSPKHSPPREVSPRVASPKPDPLIVSSQQAASSHVALPKSASPKAASPRFASSKVNQNRKETSNVYRAEPTFQVLQLSAIRIQSIFRGYMARKNFRSLRGLLRLQGFIRGDNVKKQTVNAMKQMHLFVRIQNQIRLRRIEMTENQAAQWQTSKNYKDGESTLSKWSLPSEAGHNENWDGSRLTKDEVDERRQKKLEATMKRERAMAYAYSHKLWKANPKYKMNIQSNGFPLWWKWLEHALPSVNHSVSQSAVKKSHQSPARAISECTPRPLLRNYTEYGGHFEADTPTSTKSSVPARPKPFHTPGRTPPSSSLRKKYAHSGASFAGSPYKFPSKDDDSLTSCPPYSVPNYMSPTISAKAKASPREGSIGTPSSHSGRRLSYPLNVGSFKWNRGSSKGGASSLKDFSGSADRLSVDSAVSMPASVDRKPFNRFV